VCEVAQLVAAVLFVATMDTCWLGAACDRSSGGYKIKRGSNKTTMLGKRL